MTTPIYDNIYINGEWVSPGDAELHDLINPATGKLSGKTVYGSAEDVDKAVMAAKAAFPTFSRTTREERITYLKKFSDRYKERIEDVMHAVTMDLGSPRKFNLLMHGPAGYIVIDNNIEALKEIELEKPVSNSLIVREPIGVAALICAWNWPSFMMTTKIATALAAGCTIVFKHAELSTHTAMIITEILDSIGLPKGVFNMVQGSGSVVGNAMTSHPDVDFISFTGSEGVGTLIAKNAADTIKKVGLELGGKNAFIVLPGTDIQHAALNAVMAVMPNSGQMCGAGSRTIVPAEMHDEFVQTMKAIVESLKVGDPTDEEMDLGSVVSEKQWNTIQGYISSGIEEGATLITGGLGKPEGLENGFFVKPTVFGNATNQMKIAREEIFGPVATVIPYGTVEEAIDMANDSPYGLAGYVFGPNQDEAVEIARQIRTGYVSVNTTVFDLHAPWGGYKTSGIGRENGVWGLEDMLETKAINNYKPQQS